MVYNIIINRISIIIPYYYFISDTIIKVVTLQCLQKPNQYTQTHTQDIHKIHTKHSQNTHKIHTKHTQNTHKTHTNKSQKLSKKYENKHKMQL